MTVGCGNEARSVMGWPFWPSSPATFPSLPKRRGGVPCRDYIGFPTPCLRRGTSGIPVRHSFRRRTDRHRNGSRWSTYRRSAGSSSRGLRRSIPSLTPDHRPEYQERANVQTVAVSVICGTRVVKAPRRHSDDDHHFPPILVFAQCAASAWAWAAAWAASRVPCIPVGTMSGPLSMT